MKTIGYREALDLLNRAVTEQGEDHVYVTAAGERAGNGGSCTYFHEDKPGCIVGHVLSYVGVTAGDMETGEFCTCRNPGEWRDYNEETGITDPPFVTHLASDCNLEFTADAANLLARAQSQQDAGNTWGASVRVAREWIERGL